MAGPIMHIVLAVQLLVGAQDLSKSDLNSSNFGAFVVGSVMSDSRYFLKEPGLTREKTHIEPVCMQDLADNLAYSAFFAGMLGHNIVDIMRLLYIEPFWFNRVEKIDLPRGRTPYAPDDNKYYPTLEKFAEDAVAYRALPAGVWAHIVRCFDTVYLDELRLICQDINKLHAYHRILQDYIRAQPDFEVANRFMHATSGVDFDTIDRQKFDARAEYDALCGNKTFRTMIKKFVNNFLTLLPAPEVSLETPWDYIDRGQVTPKVQEISSKVDGASPVYDILTVSS